VQMPFSAVQLVDLEMLSFQAWNFFWCGVTLKEIEQDCLVSSVLEGDVPVFAVTRELDERATNKALSLLKHVAVEFSGIELRITAETIDELIAELEKKSRLHSFQWLIDQVKAIQRLSRKEIKGKAFFYVPAERMKFFPRVKDLHVFGKDVGDAFPSATRDVTESGVCLALGRGSACVFHLMRVLEIGLTALGAKFGVSLAHTNWSPAIDEIESKIREMHKDPAWKALSDCKQQQEFYAQAASHFGILKDAWRNYTMHVRGFYTEEQAERVFENVKGFMQKLAERLSE
jgi:hypothetical protein